MLLDDMLSAAPAEPASGLEADAAPGGSTAPILTLRNEPSRRLVRAGRRHNPVFLQAHAMLNKGEFEAALALVEAAVEEEPGEGEASLHVARGYALAHLDRTREAVSAYSRSSRTMWWP